MVNSWSIYSLSNRQRLQKQKTLNEGLDYISQLSTFLTGTISLYQQGQGSAVRAKMTLKMILPSCWRKLHFQLIESPAFTKKEIISPLIFIDKLCIIFLVMYPSPSYPPIFDIQKQRREAWDHWLHISFNIIPLGDKRFVCYSSKKRCFLHLFCILNKYVLWFLNVHNLDRHSKIRPQGGTEPHFHITNSRMA